MIKLYSMIFATMMVAGTVQAHCGACGDDAKKAKDKAACTMKAGEKKAECAADKAKAGCAMKAGEKKAECAADKAKAGCPMKAGEKKAECAAEKK